MTPFVRGALVGGVIWFALLSAVGIVALRHRLRNLPRAAHYGMVIVCSTDLAEGTVLTLDMLAQRWVSDEFVTDSNIDPAFAKDLIGKVVTVPMKDGDAFAWANVIDPSVRAAREACVAKFSPAFEAVEERAASNVLGRFKAPAERSNQQGEEGQPALELDDEGDVKVLAVARELGAGEPLTTGVLRVVGWPKTMMTDSLVPASALARISGTRTVARLGTNDVLHWQQLDPGSELACALAVNSAQHDACALAFAQLDGGLAP